MDITYETNEYGELVKVTTYPDGRVEQELDRPVPTQTGRRAEIESRLAEIDRLSSTPRAQREIACGNLTWAQSLEAEAQTLRDELRGL